MHELFKIPWFLRKDVEYCTGPLIASLVFHNHINFLGDPYTVHSSLYFSHPY